MDNPFGLVKVDETIQLTPEKKEDCTFNGWKVEFEEYNPNKDAYDDQELMVTFDGVHYEIYTKLYNFKDNLRTFTMPEFNDAGRWTFTAQYKEGCDHKNTEISGQMEATCGHVGYTGDIVCSECGKVMKRGEEIDKLEHKHTHMVEETEVLVDYKGNVVK